MDSEETDIGSRPKKLKTCGEVNKEDFISGLPDSVLLHILSFLPLKDAIKTVLIPRFGKLWLNLPVLDLDNCGSHADYYSYYSIRCEYENLMGILGQILNHQNNLTLDKVCLRFPFAPDFAELESPPDSDYEDPFNDGLEMWVKEKNAADQIEKLISHANAADLIEKFIGHAISRKVKVLDLSFVGCLTSLSVKHYYQLPDVFRSNYLTDLWLAFCDIKSCEKLNLGALRVLSLVRVLLSDDIMAKVFLGCPFLEDLSVVWCYGLGNLNCENQNLKKLVICHGGADEITYLYISCPHVLSLKMSGRLEHVTLLDVSSLVDASIKFHHVSKKYDESTYRGVLRLLMKVRRCENFTPCRECILVLSIYKLNNPHRCPHFRWKKVMLELDMKKDKLPGLSCLLQGSLHVETLDIYIKSTSQQLFQTKDTKWIREYDFNGDNFWDSQVATLPCLETVTIFGWVHEPDVFQFVKFLLENAPNLQKMEIANKKTLEPYLTRERDGLSSEQMLELAQKLSMFPKASSRAKIHFS